MTAEAAPKIVPFPDLAEACAARARDRQDTGPVDRIRVSGLAPTLRTDGGLDCIRRAVFPVTHAAMRPAFGESLLASMAKGTEEEETVRARLRLLGAGSVTGGQEEVSDRAPRLPLVGHTDFMLDWGAGPVLAEVKSADGNTWPDIQRALAQGGMEYDYGHRRSYPAQLRLYMMLKGVGLGVLILSNRSSLAMAHQIIAADAEWEARARESAETVRTYAVPILDRLNAGAEPDALEIMAMLPPHPEPELDIDCTRCLWRTTCKPGRRYKRDREVITDPYAAGLLDVFLMHAEAAVQANTAEEDLRERIKVRLEELPAETNEWEFVGDGAVIHCKRSRKRTGEHHAWRIDIKRHTPEEVTEARWALPAAPLPRQRP